MNAGELNERVEILTLTQSGIIWTWEAETTVWAKAERTEKSNIFSSIGISARSAAFTIRRRELTLHNALRWHGRHCFLTDIRETPDRGSYEITAALVEPVVCEMTRMQDKLDGDGQPIRDAHGRLIREAAPLLTCPAVLIEKYAGYEWKTPRAVSETRYVLVTPKVIELKLADLVRAGGVTYYVQAVHEADAYKNEYEIAAKEDI